MTNFSSCAKEVFTMRVDTLTEHHAADASDLTFLESDVKPFDSYAWSLKQLWARFVHFNCENDNNL